MIVPEPNSIFLFLIGTLFLLSFRHKRPQDDPRLKAMLPERKRNVA